MSGSHSGGGSDPFERVAKATAGAAPTPDGGKPPSGVDGEHVAPVPADAPPLPAKWKIGEPAATWCYRDAGGAVLRYVLRFAKPEGDKDIRPATLWRDAPGKPLRWRLAAEPGPRPLYGLDRLAVRPDAAVLLVEGEKTADAAGERFPDHVAITWPGGSNAVGKANFGALNGRHVIVWPDADEPGRKAAQTVVRAALSAGALSAATVSLPGFLPKGWDLADDWPDGFGAEDAVALIARVHQDAHPNDGVEWPWAFHMEADGLIYDQPVKDGAVVPQRLSAPFQVLAEARGSGGDGWAVVIRFRDRDGREKTVPVSRSRLAGGGAEVRAELADQGLIISPARGKSDKFTAALAEVRSTRRMVLVSATGWCGDRFIVPGRPIGPVGGEPVLFTGEAPSLHYRQAGSLDGWRCHVAAKAEGNSLLTFALSLAFAGPLLRLLDLEGGGVHFRGSSSCGKTTLAYAAGSVWGGGGPLGFGHTWRSTANALEMLAAGHNDGLVVLDELALVTPEEAGTSAYSLASGQSKGRSHATGAARKRVEWRVMVLSTGEIGLADHIRSSKKGERPMAGQELRLLDIGADAGANMGIWEELHGAGSPAALSDAIKAACARDFGHAGPAFVERLVADRPAAIARAKAIVTAFLVKAREEGDSGQAQRAAVRFAAVAAAGELACAFSIAPWAPGSASAAALALYHRWARAFGRSAPREERDVLQRIRAVIESERSAFSPLGDEDITETATPSVGGRDGEARSLKTYGFRWVRGPEVLWCFHKTGWAEVLKGFNPVDAARAVSAAGFLETDKDPKVLTKSVKVKGQRQRFYCVKPSIAEADLGD